MLAYADANTGPVEVLGPHTWELALCHPGRLGSRNHVEIQDGLTVKPLPAYLYDDEWTAPLTV